jgi:hypothetical protein
MPEINHQRLNELLADHRPPCVSIYMPVHRARPVSRQDPVRLRDNVERMREQLAGRYDERTIRELADKVIGAAASENGAKWEGDRDGLAIFASPDFLRVIELQAEPNHPIREQVVVADTFHIKPLIRRLQYGDRYQVLCLEVKRVSLFEGDRYRLVPVELKNVPQNPYEVAGMRLSREVDSATDLFESPRQQSQGPGAPVEESPVEHFFHAVDKAIWENHSRASRLPLILCCAEQYQRPFHDLSRNQYLLDEGIALNPHRLPPPRIHAEAWKIIAPRYDASVNKLTDEFRAAKAHHQGSDELMQVAEAASTGRVGTLLVQENAHIPGILQPASGMVFSPDPTHPGDDVLNDLAELVLKQDGRVVVLPPESMPTDTGLAAIYRY